MDRYRSIKEVGKGSFGIVYQAQRLSDGTIVAMKKIYKLHRNENELKNLRQEWDIQRKLNHPNIIRMLDAFETPDFMVIITEYAQQGELARLINHSNGKIQGLSESTVKKITCDLVSALNYLFNQRILHRDLKPQNILIGSDGLCKLCDFGFAKTIGIDDFLLTSIKGTPLYMAPEIFRSGTYDQKAELWSLGCIIYELLVGKPPFLTTSIFELTTMIHTKDIEFPHTIFVGDCRSFVKGLLEKYPERRLSWDKILDHPFIRDQLQNIDRTRGEFSLTKTLSPSQELLKEKQRLAIQKKVQEYLKLMSKTQKRMEKAKKELEKCETQTHSPNSGQHLKLVGNQPQNHSSTTVVRPKLSPSSAATTRDTNKIQAVTNMVENLQIIDKNPDNTNQDDNSDSSCETLTSSSDDETDSEEEDVRTIVNDSGNDGNVVVANNGIPTSLHHQGDLTNGKPVFNLFWNSGALFSLHSLGSEDKPIQSEEWIHFLVTTMKEVMENPQCICEKHFLTVLVAPLRNHLTTPDVVEKIADVLSVPFAMDDNIPDGLLTPLQSMYIDSKVLPNLLYSIKVTIRRCGIENNTKELEEIINFLSVEDLASLNKCLRLVCYLVYLEKDFVYQFCDSLCVLQLFPTLLLLLKLDSKNVSFTSDTLSILCQLMRMIPSNFCIVEELFFGNCPIAKNVDELWRLLKHSDSRIKSRSIRLLTYLSVNSSKTGDKFIDDNALKLWKCVKDAHESDVYELRDAANFASRNIKPLTINDIESRQPSVFVPSSPPEILVPHTNNDTNATQTSTTPATTTDESRTLIPNIFFKH